MTWPLILLPLGVGLFVIAVVWWLLNPPPRLEIGERGILDRELGWGWIPWEEIEGAYPPTQDDTQTVRLRLRVTERLAGILNRKDPDLAGSVEVRLDLTDTELNAVELLQEIVSHSHARRRETESSPAS